MSRFQKLPLSISMCFGQVLFCHLAWQKFADALMDVEREVYRYRPNEFRGVLCPFCATVVTYHQRARNSEAFRADAGDSAKGLDFLIFTDQKLDDLPENVRLPGSNDWVQHVGTSHNFSQKTGDFPVFSLSPSLKFGLHGHEETMRMPCTFAPEEQEHLGCRTPTLRHLFCARLFSWLPNCQI